MTKKQLIKLHGTLAEFKTALLRAVDGLMISVDEAITAEKKYEEELKNADCRPCGNKRLIGWGLRADGTHITVPCVSCRPANYEFVTKKLVHGDAFYSSTYCKKCGCNAAEQEGDCPAGKWWLACANCGKKL
jgi:hypothetical protein